MSFAFVSKSQIIGDGHIYREYHSDVTVVSPVQAEDLALAAFLSTMAEMNQLRYRTGGVRRWSVVVEFKGPWEVRFTKDVLMDI